VLSTSHEPKGESIREAGRRGKERPQRPFFDQSRNLFQHLASQLFVAVEDRVHGHDVTRRCSATPQRDARSDKCSLTDSMKRPNSARQERPSGSLPLSAFKRRLLPCHPSIKHGLGEIAATRIDHVFHPGVSSRARLLGLPALAMTSAPSGRDLDCSHSDATGAGMNEDALSRLNAPFRSACHAVMNATGNVAADSNVSPVGMRRITRPRDRVGSKPKTARPNT
jgi:hypothetical protein